MINRLKYLIFLPGFVINSCNMVKMNSGEFEAHADIGKVNRSGSFSYNPETSTYHIAASGENMWGSADEMHFAWRRMNGDCILTAVIEFTGERGHQHKKAGVMIRQSTSPGSAYADAIVHANGLTSLQFRKSEGAETEEITGPELAEAHVVRIERRGNTFLAYAARAGEPMRKIGEIRIEMEDPVYVGVAMTAHDDQAYGEARLSNVRFTVPQPETKTERRLISRLETVDVSSGLRKVIYQDTSHFEAPNWTGDGHSFIFNSGGRLYKIPAEGGSRPVLINTGFAVRCNNDHGLSFDGKWLAVSHHGGQKGESLIYTLPSGGGDPQLITPNGPSYWHGWSPDGKTLAYCAERNGNFDIYTIPVAGGKERRLTNAEGLDDGPDYSSDGRYIYFNSIRSGTMQIWRMKTDGSEQEQMTFDEYHDWFPHPSPDGKWVAFLSYPPDVDGHPANKQVMLRMIPMEGGDPRTIAWLYGGQGTINVPSWSPDSRHIAFVSYTYLEPEH